MSEQLLSVGNLSVVVATRCEAGLDDPHNLVEMISKGYVVDEASKMVVCGRQKSVYSGGYIQCVGSFVHTGSHVMMTHHKMELI